MESTDNENVVGNNTVENEDDEFNKLWLEYYNAVIVEERKKGDQGYLWEGEHVTLKFGLDSDDCWEKTVFNDNVTMLDIHNENSDVVAGEVNDANLIKINSLPKLGSLSIYKMPINGTGFKALTNLKNLKCITISEALPLSDFFEHVNNFSELISIFIDKSKLSRPNWRNLLKNSKLKTLGFEACSLTDEDLANFPSLPNIDSLYFVDNDLTCLNFGFIRDMPRLERIDLRNNCKFGRDGLKIITEAGKNSLTYITPQNCPLIDDSCIKYFLPLKKIQVIDLSGTNVSETGIGKLKSLKTLRQLFLSEQVSVEFAKKLQEKYMPKCHFCWVGHHEKNLDALEWSEDYD
jgi:hypothetical protein